MRVERKHTNNIKMKNNIENSISTRQNYKNNKHK